VLDLLVALTHGFLWEPLPEVQPQQQPQPRVRRVVDFSGRS
jgi:hypothetical protein